MIRLIAICFALALPLAVPTLGVAQQKSWSGTAEPTNEREWARAAQLRVKTIAPNLFATSAGAGAAARSGEAHIVVRVRPDGSIEGVRLVSASGSEALDQQLQQTFSRLPQLPKFTPDMRYRRMNLQIPIEVKR